MTLFRNLLIGCLIVLMILWSFAHKSETQRRTFLVVFSLIGVVFYLINWALFILKPHLILELLPLQLCDLAIFMLPIGLMTKKEKLLDFLFYACGLGALSALFLMAIAEKDSFYDMNFNFFFSHFAILMIPYLTVYWGMYDPKPNLGKAFELTMELLILTAFMHGLNLFLHAQYKADAFYFFTVRRIGVEVSPLLAWFAKVIPFDYWYMTLTLPILYLYMALVEQARKLLIRYSLMIKNSP